MKFIAIVSIYQLFTSGVSASNIRKCGKVGEIDAYLKKLNNVATQHFDDKAPEKPGVNSRAASVDEAKFFSIYAGLAYCSNETIAAWSCKHCRALGKKRPSKVIYNAKDKTRALLLVDNDRKEIVLTFRGTAETENWLKNVNFCKKQFIHGQVHEGFLEVANNLKAQYKTTLISYLNANKAHKLIVTGHSLGGAVAVLSTAMLQKELGLNWNRIQLITYGQPRVGDIEFASWLNVQPLKVTRVVNGNDIVPHAPPRFTQFFHSHTEMYIDNGRPRLCKTDRIEDKTCSNSQRRSLSAAKHSKAFSTILGAGGC